MDADKKEGRIISFSKAKQAQLDERRRKHKRLLFKNLLACYCVVEGEGLKAVELVDVSLEGISFQLPADSKNLKWIQAEKEMSFRFYFSPDSFLNIRVNILHSNQTIENKQHHIRFGCQILTDTKSYEAFRLFVLFLTKYLETSSQDNGNLNISYF